MYGKIRQLAPHVSILICNMYIVFYLIDCVNTAMCFIDNGFTKGLLVIMCLISAWNSWILIQSRRRVRARQSAPAHQMGTRMNSHPSGMSHPARTSHPSGTSRPSGRYDGTRHAPSQYRR